MSTPEEQDFATFEAQGEQHGWPQWAAVFLTRFSQVPSKSRAAEEAGISAQTVRRLELRNDAFSDAVVAARETALDRLESTVYLRATVGAPVTKTITKTRRFRDGSEEITTIETSERHTSDILAMFYLKKWRPDYRDNNRAEPSGVDSGPIEVGDEKERLHEAAERFRAEVIRLADYRPAGESSSNGSG